jgi:hypothetical protein
MSNESVMQWLTQFKVLCPHGHQMKIVDREIKGDEITVCFKCIERHSYTPTNDKWNSLTLCTSMKVWFTDRLTGKEYTSLGVTKRHIVGE